MTNWLWQYTAAAAAAAGGTTTDPQFVTESPVNTAVPDAAATNGLIVYQLGPDGTPTAAYAPVGSDLTLEPGEVRLPPPTTTTAQTNGTLVLLLLLLSTIYVAQWLSG